MSNQAMNIPTLGRVRPNAENSNHNDNDCPVANALRRSARGGMWFVRCEFQEGLATLYGKVDSFYLKQLAQETAKNVEGVEQVINRVDVSLQK